MSPGGRGFKATLVKRLNIGRESVAIFRVVRSPRRKNLAGGLKLKEALQRGCSAASSL